MRFRHSNLQLLFPLLMLHLACLSGNLGCKESGYCSIGKTKTFIGDISSGSALRSMLVQVSFRNELIVVPATFKSPKDGYGDMILQLHQDLINVGFSHLVYISGDDMATCKNLEAENRKAKSSIDYV